MNNYKKYILALCLIIISLCAFVMKNIKKPKNNTLNIEQRVDSLLALMNIDEKIGQLIQYTGSENITGPPSSNYDKEKKEKLRKGEIGSLLNVSSRKTLCEVQKQVLENSRLKIPMIFAYDVIHGYKTIFPIPLGESASWDLELIKKTARIAAKESSADGLHWTFAPMVDVSRDARWGRGMEGAGEDPYLVTKISIARVKGFQGDNLAKDNTIAACAKHFAGYGFAEAGRDYNTVNIGNNLLHNQILPPFKALANIGVATFMNAFNEIDGIPATGHKELQRKLLKEKWNWNGMIVSDWASIAEMVNHGYAKNKKHAAEIAINAGSDMDMEGHAYNNNLKTLLNENKISINVINDAVKRVLRLKFKLGLFDNPYKYCNEQRENKDIYTSENLNVAREAGKKSIVLLKNENNILPLSKKIKNIAVIGPLANDKDSPLGNWRALAKYNSAVSLLEGVKAKVSKKTNVFYQKGIDLIIQDKRFQNTKSLYLYEINENTSDKSKINDAVEIAKKADIVLLAVGEHGYQSGESRSKTNLGFTGLQNELINEIYKVNKNIVLVLSNGRPMDLSSISDRIPAILVTWQLGSESGNAIADVIFGDYNPSAKLPVSFPRNVGQQPLYYNQKNTGRPYNMNMKEVTNSSYRDVKNTALYPFGYGLSYTTFEYKNLKLNKHSINKNEEIIATIDVTNTGKRSGEEIIQMYIRDIVGSLTRPVIELKGFKKEFFKAGETKTIKFIIGKKQLQYYTANKIWEVEPGEFKVMIGKSSIDTINASFNVK